MGTRYVTGKYGEKLAAEFLEKKGYTIIAKNYRFGRAEIDIIAQQKNVVVFVEVKTRKNHQFGTPEAFVSEAQAERIFEAAEAYQAANEGEYQIRFDIISITGKPPQCQIEHFPDAFF